MRFDCRKESLYFENFQKLLHFTHARRLSCILANRAKFYKRIRIQQRKPCKMPAAPAIRNEIIARLVMPSRTKTGHLRKRLTTDRLTRQNKRNKISRFQSNISTREAITASSVADAPCGGKKFSVRGASRPPKMLEGLTTVSYIR